MKTLYFDCSSGICGDLLLGAFLDLGIDVNFLNSELKSLDLKERPFIEDEKPEDSLISGTLATVKTEMPVKSRKRDHSEIKRIIMESSLKETVKTKSLKVFDVIAKAEAKIHSTEPDNVHFHEVGAVDSICDIVSICNCFEILGPSNNIFSKLPISTGIIGSAHGPLPLPAPAAALILEGIPVYGADTQKELVTPTGAAVAKVFASSFGTFPAMTIESSGTGHAKNRFESLPGILRIFKRNQDRTYEQARVISIETNIDDYNTEMLSYVQERLFHLGALDVTLTPVIMKKGRPGHILSVLCSRESFEKLSFCIFEETSTIGFRYTESARKKLPREEISVDTPFGMVKAKRTVHADKISVTPEYEELKRIALERNVPIIDVYRRILSALNNDR
jgi:hypothetical protein